MAVLDVRRTTIYCYNCAVRFGDHRLILRPRDSYDLRCHEPEIGRLIETVTHCDIEF
jgi:hypothetical protein